jgi:competence protein ComEC
MYGIVAAFVLGPSKLRPMVEGIKRAGARAAKAGAALPILALVAILVWTSVFALPDERLHIYFLDVGQGDAILLRTPEGHAVLVDGGPDPLLLASQLGKALPFWQRRIDMVILTHGDSDHLAGLLPLLNRYRVGSVLEPPVMPDNALVNEWHARLASHGITPRKVWLGAEIRLGNQVALETLNPDLDLTSSNDVDTNAGSLAMRLVMGGCRVLLMGDADELAETRLLERGQATPSLLLKVAHHGAKTATSEAFLEAVRPRYAVVSVGRGNRFGHPDPAVVDRLRQAGCQVYRTDEVGTVHLSTDGKRYWIGF